MKERIYMASPTMHGEEQKFVQEAFDTNWIAPLGKNVNEFEKELAAYVGSKDAAALSAGSAALHLALKAAGVKAGDIVFCQDLTFSATANPIIYEDAVPVFIDSDYETWNMSPEALELLTALCCDEAILRGEERPTARRIEKLGLEWARLGVRSRADAVAAIQRMARREQTVAEGRRRRPFFRQLSRIP